MRPAKTTSLLGFLVAALLGVGVALPEPSAAATQNHPVVLVIGDSLTVGAEKRGGLSQRLRRAGFRPMVHDVNGMTTQAAVPVLEKTLSRRKADLVVIALGTNDAMFWDGRSWYARRVKEVLAATRGTPVLWLDVRLQLDKSHVREVNRELHRAANRHENMTVLAWSKSRGAGMLAYDGIHLNTSGYHLRAAFITKAVKETLTRTAE